MERVGRFGVVMGREYEESEWWWGETRSGGGERVRKVAMVVGRG